jgi:hypothetical protein
MSDWPPVTVVETPEFLSASRKLLDEDERSKLIDHLARRPDDGNLVPGTGGIRKLRWAVGTRGKRGGARVIYFFHDHDVPLFLLTAYAKNERANLSGAERNMFRKVIKTLVSAYLGVER